MNRFLPVLLVSLTGLWSATAALRVPANTAYLEPRHEGARVSERGGITQWTDPDLRVLWYGEFKQTGAVECAVELKLPAGSESKLQLTLGKESRTRNAIGSNDVVTVAFGSFQVTEAGYQRFELASLNPAGQPAGDIQALILDGAPVDGAHFNLKPRRNAASVHLSYPIDGRTNVDAFYCEVTAVDDPITTYYMACGWHRGYFGMQVNSPSERRIIFSVWDSGDEGADRGKVGEQDRVRLVAKGEDVYTGDFGNEGTGGHSHLKYPWKTGERQRFLLTAQPIDATHTVFSGFYFHPDKKQWMLISSWKAPKEGGYLRGLYSFSENFWGSSGHVRRKARYGNQWIHQAGDSWTELTTASFSHDATGRADRRDRFMGVENGQFFLSHGGFVPGYTAFGEKFTRPATGKPPEVDLKELLRKP